MGGFFCVSNLGAYIWRSLFSEFYGSCRKLMYSKASSFYPYLPVNVVILF